MASFRKIISSCALTIVFASSWVAMAAESSPYKTTCECFATVNGNEVAIGFNAEDVVESSISSFYEWEHNLEAVDQALGVTCKGKGESVRTSERDQLDADIASGSFQLQDGQEKHWFWFPLDIWSRNQGATFKMSGLSIESSRGTITALRAKCSIAKI